MTEMKTLFWDSDDVPSTGSSVLRVALEQELVATSVTDTQNLDDCRHFFKGSFENNSEYRKNFKTVSGLVELIKRLMAVSVILGFLIALYLLILSQFFKSLNKYN